MTTTASTNPSIPRTPYAKLRFTARGATPSPLPQALDPGLAADSLNQDVEKIDALLTALWAAFEANPTELPLALVDLTAAYTSALRLRLNIAAWAAHCARLAKLQLNSEQQGQGPSRSPPGA